MLKPSFIYSVLILNLTSSLALAAEGGSGSHGGDILVSEFVTTEENMAYWYQNRGSLKACKVSASEMEALILGRPGVTRDPLRLRVRSAPRVYVNLIEQDAATDATEIPQVTLLSRTRLLDLKRASDAACPDRKKPCEAREKNRRAYGELALHEAFVALKKETTNETRDSRACYAAMLEAGMPAAVVVDDAVRFDDVPQAFADQRLKIVCDPVGDPERPLKITLDAGAVTVDDHRRAANRSPFMGTAKLREDYSPETGETTVVFLPISAISHSTNRRGTEEYEVDEASATVTGRSTDGIHFKMEFVGKLNRWHSALDGKRPLTADCKAER